MSVQNVAEQKVTQILVEIKAKEAPLSPHPPTLALGGFPALNVTNGDVQMLSINHTGARSLPARAPLCFFEGVLTMFPEMDALVTSEY